MPKIKLLIWSITLLLFCSFDSGCRPPAECREFLDLPLNRRHVEFRNYSIERQLDIYPCGRSERPPDRSLAYIIAERGDEAIPFIVARLKSEQDEGNQDNLISILEVMSYDGHLRGKQDVIEQIRQIISAMRFDAVRERSLERLRRIEINS